MAFSVLLLVLVGNACGQNFMEKGNKGEIDSAYLNGVIQGALDNVLGSGHGINQERLNKINATLAPLFNALPRNRNGRLTSPHMRYIVQRYFIERHGWVVKGFEPHPTKASNASESSNGHTAHIVHGKVPSYVEGALKKTVSQAGFALNDIAVLVATIEILIFDETLKALHAAYFLNSLSTDSALSKNELMAILKSYFIVEHLNGDDSNIQQHTFDCEHIGEYYPHWEDTEMFLADIVGEDAFLRKQSVNPFEVTALTFKDVTRVARTLSERFGPFSNHECHDMKEQIAALDVHGTGRVKLADFYRTGAFLESAEYLESMGSLDTSSAWQGPQVIIPNYLLGMNNCISTSPYYDVCCLNECDAVYQHLEASFKAPTAPADKILKVIEDGIASSPLLSSNAPTEARTLPNALHVRLALIAEHHNGKIPLHGRLFAQWLHYAFPRECPYPHMRGTIIRTYDSNQETQMATEEQIQEHLNSHVGQQEPSPEAGINMWIMDEELLDPEHIFEEEWSFKSWSPVLRTFAHIVMLAGFASLVLKELSRLFSAKSQNDGGRDNSYYV